MELNSRSKLRSERLFMKLLSHYMNIDELRYEMFAQVTDVELYGLMMRLEQKLEAEGLITDEII